MNNYIEDFKNNRLWIHIKESQMNLVEELENLLPDIKFRSGDDLTSRTMLNALDTGEAWFRCESGVVYNKHYPRESGAWDISPWIYKNGEIIDIEEFLTSNRIKIEEDEIVALFT